MFDRAAVGEVEFAGFRVGEIVRGEGGRGDGKRHGRHDGEGELLEDGKTSCLYRMRVNANARSNSRNKPPQPMRRSAGEAGAMLSAPGGCPCVAAA